jgi:hypothetical protein
MPEIVHDLLCVGDNTIHVYYSGITEFPDNYTQINGSVLYGLLRRGNWYVFITNSSPVYIMMSTYDDVAFYKIELQEFNKFLHHYCGSRYKQELDWRKCGF